jgi:KDO2-lipid IV(A) lauroyltransferase
VGKRRITTGEYIGYILEAIIVIPLSLLIALLPFWMGYALADALAFLLFHLDKKNKKWAYENLNIIFAENPLPKKEADALVKKVYKNLARGGFEYFKLWQITEKNASRYGYFENYHIIEECLAQGKGVIVVTCHLGNWEYFGSISVKQKKSNLAVIINRQFNPFTDAWLKFIREKWGKVRCFYNEVSDMKGIVRHLRENGVIAILADQTYYFKPIFVPFFGKQSATADGPAKLHLRYGAPIVMGFSIRESDGRYRFVFEKPYIHPSTGNMEKDAAEIMTYINSRYEEYIRKYPEQWFSLLHPRWEKTRPEDFVDIDWDPF